MVSRRYVVVGEGAAGTTAAVRLRALDPDCQITVVSDEPARPYYRAALTNYLLGELTAEQLWAGPEDHHERYCLQRVVDQAYEVDVGFRRLKLAGGSSLEYDALLLASGARARRPPFAGAGLSGVLTLRDMADAEACLRLVPRTAGSQSRVSRAAVVGGGPLALEWAHALFKAGVHVTLFLRGEHFLPGALDAVGSDLLMARLVEAGVEVRIADEIESAGGDAEGRLASVVTKRTRETLPCQLIACAIGIEPRTEFLRGGPFDLARSGALRVGEGMQTNIAGVYAAGDVAEFEGRTLGLWAPAQAQAQIAAANMVRGAGGGLPPDCKTRYEPGVHYMATRLYDLDFASVGQVDSNEATQSVVDFPEGTGAIAYRKLFLKDGRLIGAVMLGEQGESIRRNGRMFKTLIDERRDVGRVAARLLDDRFDLRSWMQERSAPAIDLSTNSSQPPARRRTSTFAIPPRAEGGS